jgi:hypothetical protein
VLVWKGKDQCGDNRDDPGALSWKIMLVQLMREQERRGCF